MPALLDVDPDVFLAVGRRFLTANDAAADAVAAAANTANGAGGMAGVDSTGATWARGYDSAADALLRAGATVVDALGVVGDRLAVSGTNHADADAASVPRSGAGPPAYAGQPGTTGAVGVVVSKPPSADGTPTDPPPGWNLVAHLIAGVWPAGHPDQLRAVGTGWLTASLRLTDQADGLTGAIADLAGQTSPEIPYAVGMCTGLQDSLRTLADQYAVAAHACTGYANAIGQMHQDVVVELIDLVASETLIQIIGAIASAPTSGAAEVPAQAVAGSRAAVSAGRIMEILGRLAKEVVSLQNIVQGVVERTISVLVELQKVTAARDTLAAVTALVDAGIPPVDLVANDRDNPRAHVIERHVDKSDAYLIGRNIPVASTFTSLATATTAISALVAANRPSIAAWLAGTKRGLTLTGPLSPGAGRSYVRDSHRFVASTRLRIELVRNDHGYFIVTAYPEP